MINFHLENQKEDSLWMWVKEQVPLGCETDPGEVPLGVQFGSSIAAGELFKSNVCFPRSDSVSVKLGVGDTSYNDIKFQS